MVASRETTSVLCVLELDCIAHCIARRLPSVNEGRHQKVSAMICSMDPPKHHCQVRDQKQVDDGNDETRHAINSAATILTQVW
jgi:hypothetical protein